MRRDDPFSLEVWLLTALTRRLAPAASALYQLYRKHDITDTVHKTFEYAWGRIAVEPLK